MLSAGIVLLLAFTAVARECGRGPDDYCDDPLEPRYVHLSHPGLIVSVLCNTTSPCKSPNITAAAQVVQNMQWVEIDGTGTGFMPIPPDTPEFIFYHRDAIWTPKRNYTSTLALLSTALQAIQHLQGEVRTLKKELKKRPEPVWMKSKPVMITTIGTCPETYDAAGGCEPHQVSPNMCTWDCQRRVADNPY